MRCRRARRAIVERELEGYARASADGELRLHLERCPSCAVRAREERAIVDELATLRSVPPRAIDATPRAMRDIARLGRIDRADLAARELAWATAAALSFGLLLAILLLAALPALPRALDEARGAATTLDQIWERNAPVLFALIALPFRMLGSALELLSGIGSLLARLEPLAFGFMLSCCLIMVTTVASVVTRDLTRARPGLLRKEN